MWIVAKYWIALHSVLAQVNLERTIGKESESCLWVLETEAFLNGQLEWFQGNHPFLGLAIALGNPHISVQDRKEKFGLDFLEDP